MPPADDYIQALRDEQHRRINFFYSFVAQRQTEIDSGANQELYRQFRERCTMPNTTTISYVALDEAIHTAAPTNEAVKFILQQNVAAIELRALKEEYPRAVFMYDYNLPACHVLQSQYATTKDYIYKYRLVEGAYHALQNSPVRLRRIISAQLTHNLPSRIVEKLERGTEGPKEFTVYPEAVSAVKALTDYRAQFRAYRTRYGSQRADFEQKAALIRQKPRQEVIIDGAKILAALEQWENVWGASLHIRDDSLFITVGLCNIEMQEAAETSAYDIPTDILLAPFSFAIELNRNGSFICPSNKAFGLSRRLSSGGLNYDFHPHQLSDTPCFGSFGQTLIDLAATGDVLGLISGIIGFYSQYNSQDSAGVNARDYHPEYLCRLIGIESYHNHLVETIDNYENPIPKVNLYLDESKLREALTNYSAYHEANCCEPAPRLITTYICVACDDNPVDDDYFITAGGDRVCRHCWGDFYCSDCERHEEDCECEHEHE